MKRRNFINIFGLSAAGLPIVHWPGRHEREDNASANESTNPENLADIESLSRKRLSNDAIFYLNSASEGLRTKDANEEAYDKIHLLPRMMVDVRNASTATELFGKKIASPVLLSPVGNLGYFKTQGSIHAARAVKAKNQIMIAATLSNVSIAEIKDASNADLWFQLYTTTSREGTLKLIRQAEAVGSEVLVVTVDSAVLGKRFGFGALDFTGITYPNLEGILGKGVGLLDASLSWDIVPWLRSVTKMKIVLKGLLTPEDAVLACEHKVDGIIVSNHGGRQLETNRSTIDCLPAIAQAVDKKIPILIDGGIRRGTDVFKAIALGADAVCIGRPYVWGLAYQGQEGVEKVLDILNEELLRTMKLSGINTIKEINRNYVSGVI
ncbi:MAG TPA: alpha-hydroxy acid oxidase [Cyclobacteriaceae bacterium]|nr:alpha-hydroxy acid oxidase [Cyclobacteriaceae bacterium]